MVRPISVASPSPSRTAGSRRPSAAARGAEPEGLWTPTRGCRPAGLDRVFGLLEVAIKRGAVLFAARWAVSAGRLRRDCPDDSTGKPAPG